MHQMPGAHAPVNPVPLVYVFIAAFAAAATVAVANQNALARPLTIDGLPTWPWVSQSARQLDRSLTPAEVALVGRAFPVDMPLDAQAVAAAARVFRAWKQRSEASAPPAPPAPGGDLLKVTQNALTGETVELWRVGTAASARERDLRGIHGTALVCSTGRPPQAAAWFGPVGEHVTSTQAVTLRYRPTGAEPAPGKRPVSVLRSKARSEVLFGGATSAPEGGA